ncbi:uncharacterized protein C8Q71DRAFT_735694 [Rhodofomes roseus]|uniref:Replication protein A C-terminal domain-containing protein n=1 Tax=Rhodofomes roseus TaxID=34475 RepID=A0ABQ8KXN2_9APHY|nr:uncharacterized protein C8Q71DRAFT_735694 [Rhodofomes roseus]KAH9843055.1 hypothetical protein C8Q71DRAFT_735694 [Rhodofomes roseus]
MDGIASGSSSDQNLPYASRGALRPLTLRQILEAQRAHSTAPFVLDNVELNAITTVAHLVRADPPDESRNRFHANYTLLDGSKRIRATEMFSDDHPASNLKLSDPHVHKYVRVVGRVDQFPPGATNSIKVIAIRECTDPHEYFHHFLQCCAVTQCYKLGIPLPTVLPPLRSDRIEDTTVNDDSLMSIDEPTTAPEAHPHLWSDPLSHLNTLQRGVILAMLNNTTADGMWVREITQAVRHLSLRPEEIGDALDYLADEGYIECPIQSNIQYCVLTAKSRSASGQYLLPAN